MTDDNQHLTPEMIERLLDNAQAPAEQAAAANNHLAHCPACRTALRGAQPEAGRRLTELFAADADDASCLDEEQLTRYVHSSSDAFEIEMVEMHLDECVSCSEDVAFLRSLLKRMETPDRAPPNEPCALPQAAAARAPVIPDAPEVKPTENDYPSASPSSMLWLQW